MSEEIKLEEKELEKVTGGECGFDANGDTRTVTCPNCGAVITIKVGIAEEVVGECSNCHKKVWIWE